MTSAAQKRMEETRAYIRENFRFDDRLAIVTIPRKEPEGNRVQAKAREGQEIRPRTRQRIATAERIVSDEFQAWLRFQNAHGLGIYISMNPLRADATRRRKEDVAEIRHVYLDVDEGGAAARDALLTRDDIPAPNDILTSSPNRFQFVWSVEGFSKEAAESLMRGMTRSAGARRCGYGLLTRVAPARLRESKARGAPLDHAREPPSARVAAGRFPALRTC